MLMSGWLPNDFRELPIWLEAISNLFLQVSSFVDGQCPVYLLHWNSVVAIGEPALRFGSRRSVHHPHIQFASSFSIGLTFTNSSPSPKKSSAPFPGHCHNQQAQARTSSAKNSARFINTSYFVQKKYSDPLVILKIHDKTI